MIASLLDSGVGSSFCQHLRMLRWALWQLGYNEPLCDKPKLISYSELQLARVPRTLLPKSSPLARVQKSARLLGAPINWNLNCCVPTCYPPSILPPFDSEGLALDPPEIGMPLNCHHNHFFICCHNLSQTSPFSNSSPTYLSSWEAGHKHNHSLKPMSVFSLCLSIP